VLSLELDSLVEEGLLLAAVSVGGKLSLAVGLAERDDLSDWGQCQGSSFGETLNCKPLIVVNVLGRELNLVPGIPSRHPNVGAGSIFANVSEDKSAGLVVDRLNEPLLVLTFRSLHVFDDGRASVDSRKVGLVTTRKGLDVVDRLLSRDSGELVLGDILFVCGSEPGADVAVSALSEVDLVVGLAH